MPLNVVLDQRPVTEVDDLEIEAHVIRLCRAAPRGTRAAAILKGTQEAFPGIDNERLRRCAASAADRLMAQAQVDDTIPQARP